jgi:hypothetical protein
MRDDAFSPQRPLAMDKKVDHYMIDDATLSLQQPLGFETFILVLE